MNQEKGEGHNQYRYVNLPPNVLEDLNRTERRSGMDQNLSVATANALWGVLTDVYSRLNPTKTVLGMYQEWLSDPRQTSHPYMFRDSGFIAAMEEEIIRTVTEDISHPSSESSAKGFIWVNRQIFVPSWEVNPGISYSLVQGEGRETTAGVFRNGLTPSTEREIDAVKQSVGRVIVRKDDSFRTYKQFEALLLNSVPSQQSIEVLEQNDAEPRHSTLRLPVNLPFLEGIKRPSARELIAKIALSEERENPRKETVETLVDSLLEQLNCVPLGKDWPRLAPRMQSVFGTQERLTHIVRDLVRRNRDFAHPITHVLSRCEEMIGDQTPLNLQLEKELINYGREINPQLEVGHMNPDRYLERREIIEAVLNAATYYGLPGYNTFDSPEPTMPWFPMRDMGSEANAQAYQRMFEEHRKEHAEWVLRNRKTMPLAQLIPILNPAFERGIIT